jgi:hypothetical protein
MPENHAQVKDENDRPQAEARSSTPAQGEDLYDELSIPLENYTPRPSRSRAVREPDDLMAAIDFSKRPEATIKARARAKAKSKTKRSKTMGDALSENIVIDLDIDVLNKSTTRNEESVDPGRQADNEALDCTGVAFKEDVITKALQKDLHVIDAATAEAETAPSKKKRGRPKKTEKATLGADAVKVPSAGKQEDTTKAPGCALSEFDMAIQSGDDSNVHDHETTRKPKLSTAEELNEQPIEPAHRISIKQVTEMGDRDNSVHLDSPESSNAAKSILTAKSNPSSPVKDAQLSAPSKASSRSKHSPIATSKVPYRVGLSKKARIAPLLRIVRK